MNEREFIWNLFIRWIGFGIIICFVPIVLILLYDKIVGYDFEWDRLAPDFFLAVFAVIGNAMSNEVDTGKFRGQYIRMFFIITSVLTLIPCIYFYARLFDHNQMIQTMENARMANSLVDGYIFAGGAIRDIYKCGIFLLLVNSIIGILLEIISRAQQHSATIMPGGETDGTD